MTILLAPHNDDESLFCSYTLLRERPLVVICTDSFIQPNRGDIGCTAEIRRAETTRAMEILKCPVIFLGIKDTELTEENLTEALKPYANADKVYAPAIQGGNGQHDLVGRVGEVLFGSRLTKYTTYTKTELWTKGTQEVIPTQEEIELKNKALDCYKSQLNLVSTRPHFDAVRNKSEWINSKLKKIMITPYFGDLPEWFEKYRMAEGYEWLLDRDLESFKKRVKDKLGIECPIVPGQGKVWDYRGALGLLYEEEIKGYDFWGHTDFDCVYGDVGKWVTDDFLNQIDIHSNHGTYICGPWALYRNNNIVNTLFQRHPQWREILESPNITGWVEEGFSRIVEQSGLRYKYTFYQGNPYTSTPVLKKEGKKLYQDGQEIMMFHFRRSKRWPL